MPTKEELEQENAKLTTERESLVAYVERLTAENDRLLDAALAAAPAAAPRRPWLSEGERQELERFGVTNSPFTGERLTIDDARAYLIDEGQDGVIIGEPDPAVAKAAGYVVPAPADPIDERE